MALPIRKSINCSATSLRRPDASEETDARHEQRRNSPCASRGFRLHDLLAGRRARNRACRRVLSPGRGRCVRALGLVTWNERHLTYLMRGDTPEGQEFCRRFPRITILDPVRFIRAIDARTSPSTGP